MQTHYFIALSIPTEIKTQLADHFQTVSKDFPFQKPVHKLDYHITLAFLGTQSEASLLPLMKDIESHTMHMEAFSLTIDGYGTFGNLASPRIFWNRIQPQQTLFDLQKIVAACCHAHGFELETRPYNPHITIARKWAGKQAFHPSLLEELNPLQQEPLSFIAKEVVLYRTNLSSVPKYERILTVSLQ